MGEEYGKWCYHFEFLEGISLHLLFQASFGEIRFLKWCDIIEFKFLVFGNIKRVFRRFFFYSIQATNIFLLKLERILIKVDISCVKWHGNVIQSECYTHPPTRVNFMQCKLWEDSICKWPLKQTGLVFD